MKPFCHWRKPHLNPKLRNAGIGAIVLLLMSPPAALRAQWVPSDAPAGPSIDVIASSNGYLLAGSNNGTAAGRVLASSDSGARWDTVGLGTTPTAIFDIAADGDLVIVGTYENGALISTDGGLSWFAEFDTGIAPGVFAAAISHGNFIALTNMGVQSYRSTDTANSWSRIDTGDFGLTFGANDFFTSDGMVYAGSYRGLHYSTDHGATWIRRSNLGLYTNLDGTTNLFRIFAHRGVILAVQGNGFSFTVDTGETWTNIPFDVGPAGYVSSFAAIGDTIFAGVHHIVPEDAWGVIYTLDSGRTWTPINDGLPTGTSVLSLYNLGGRLVAGTFAGGIWHRGGTSPGSSAIRVALRQGWNLFSVPTTPADPSAGAILPGRTGGPFRFEGGYVASNNIETGAGYWVKAGIEDTLEFSTPGLIADTIQVVKGWNLIGSIGTAVPIGQIGRMPPEMTVLGPFVFNNGYQLTDSILPGTGCWIKTDRAGLIVLEATK